ncbi:MAG: hypothetical protein AB7U61_04285 [Methylocystis sp.]
MIKVFRSANPLQFLAKKHKKLVLFTHHKCASSWLTSIIVDICLNNNLKYIAIPWGRRCQNSGYTIEKVLNSDNDIVIALNADYFSIQDPLSANMQCIHVIRNPLSVIVSAYYSHLRTHPVDGWDSLVEQRRVLSQVDKDIGMALTLAFLESSHFQPETNGPLHDLRSWAYDDSRIVTLRMEDITSSTADFFATLSRTEVLKNALMPDPGRFSFAAITGRQQGATDLSSHYRCGSSDEWRDALPRGVILYMLHHYRDLLLRFYPEALL